MVGWPPNTGSANCLAEPRSTYFRLSGPMVSSTTAQLLVAESSHGQEQRNERARLCPSSCVGITRRLTGLQAGVDQHFHIPVPDGHCQCPHLLCFSGPTPCFLHSLGLTGIWSFPSATWAGRDCSAYKENRMGCDPRPCAVLRPRGSRKGKPSACDSMASGHPHLEPHRHLTLEEAAYLALCSKY